uniref:Peptidase C1A papain C-terminal domain-containing protein n=1 Tax=Arcella intermedia TaxID=1963864 RepID=A0A6B2LNZ1_9EUKA
MSAGGLETDADYPYTAQGGTCAFDKSKVKVTIKNWRYATQNKSESEMMQATVNWGPLSICVDASSWQLYDGGIFMASDCTTNLDHCVQIVGYDTTAATPFWVVRNSWSDSWGENGFIRLQFGQDTCGLADEATSACIVC